MANIQLREMAEKDLRTFFEFQLDPQANSMAAFTAKNPTDIDDFMTHWAKIMADESITRRTILFDGNIAGSIMCHSWFGEPEVTYWIGKEFWGKGIASQALQKLLSEVRTRPLHGRAASDNVASVRVLEKCGFRKTGVETAFANARGEEIEESVFILE
jgi:RimJ/RimL family protein N-acetyltransferase